MNLDTDRPIHPFCAMVPEPDEDQYDKLSMDILKNRVIREPVVIYNEQILSGRCRAAIGKLHGIPFSERVFEGTEIEALKFVLSTDFARRHMTSSQRTGIALDIETVIANLEANNRDLVAACGKEFPQAEKKSTGGNRTGKNSEGKTQSERDAVRPDSVAAAEAGTNRTYWNQGKQLREDAPDLLKEVSSGKKTIPTAFKELKARQEAGTTGPESSVVAEATTRIKDQLGDEVPEALIPAFEAIQSSKPIILEINKLLRDIEDFCKGPAGIFMSFYRVKIDLTNCRREIKQLLPYVVCPDCAGAKCKHCKQGGWITKRMYDPLASYGKDTEDDEQSPEVIAAA